MGSKILQELGLEIPVVGIAKGPSRKNVKIQMTNDKQTTNYKLPTTNFIKNIMNEAHRFAISYHKKLRKRNFLVN
jgi:excinuclease ABC subunit C